MNGVEVSRGTTGADGNVILSGLKVGETYTIEEIKPPAGYMPRGMDTVTIISQSQHLNLTNVPLVMTITLKTTYGEPIAGTRFNIKNSSGDIVGTGATEATGNLTIKGTGLIYGEVFTIEQIDFKEGYKIAEPVKVKITRALTEVNVTNGQYASLNLTLYESFTTTPLAGGTFVVKDENYNIITGPKTTDANGNIEFTGLEDGNDYIIEQISAPQGYIAIEPKRYTQDGLTYNQPIFNTKGQTEVSSLKITVVDSNDPNKKLAGAQFRVIGPNGEIYNVTTNQYGVAIITNLPNGEYKIVQTRSPDGYLPDNTEITQTLTNQSGELTIKNVYASEDVVGLKLSIIKATVMDESNNQIIANATVRATDDLGNVYYGVTDEEGKVLFDDLSVLRTYTLEVIKAPFKYGPGPWPGASYTLGFIDPLTPFYREIILFVPPAETNNLSILVHEKGDVRVPVVGTTIRITMPDGTYVDRKTDANGAISIDLPKGFDYIVQQLPEGTSNPTHPVKYTVNDETFSRYIERDATVVIPNILKNIDSEVRHINVLKN